MKPISGLRFQILDWPRSYRTYSTYRIYFGQFNLKSEILNLQCPYASA